MGRPHDDPFVLAVRMHERAAADDVTEAARLAAVLRRPETVALSPGARVHRDLAVATLAALALDPRDALGAAGAAAGEGPMVAWFAAAMAWAFLRTGELERALDAAATALRRRQGGARRPAHGARGAGARRRPCRAWRHRPRRRA